MTRAAGAAGTGVGSGMRASAPASRKRLRGARAACVLALALFASSRHPVLKPAIADSPFVVGSKAFTESVILSELAAQLAAAAGSRVQARPALGGTRVLWDALVRGEIDLYPEYTGTILEEILAGKERPADGRASLGWLRERLAAQGVGLIGPLGFDNSYAIGMRPDVADKLGARRISDLARAPSLRFGFSNEFMSRHDGWPKLRERYAFAHAQASGIDHDLAYRALEQRAIDATDLYATDAEIAYYKLRVLEDDRAVFPSYEAVYLYRLARERALAKPLAALAGLRIEAVQMRAMNARVKLDRAPEASVAADFLRAQLGLESRRRLPDRVARVLARTREHVALVALSLVLAILAALPLGVLSYKRPRLGRIVLDAVGVVQTIPSLALLVFMIPLLGIGATPAIAALFLYGLLPIVRNTYAGLADVPPQLRNAAEALGLPPRAVLRRIELPLASRAILAGIKSAAVINVGTATLGALIGAGGFGQPILTGIRLDDVGLILEGAVPASLLAIAVERLFDLAERFLVPKGLRLER